MTLRRPPWLAALAAGLALAVPGALAIAQHTHDHGAKADAAPAADTRVAVNFPAPLREHTLANMRDHLLALAEIQDAMARDDLDRAAKVAENRLGMSSLQSHGAHEVSKYMPKGMQDAGTAMHRGASRFAVELSRSSATGDLRPALGALAEVTRSCVACHAGYRLP